MKVLLLSYAKPNISFNFEHKQDIIYRTEFHINIILQSICMKSMVEQIPESDRKQIEKNLKCWTQKKTKLMCIFTWFDELFDVNDYCSPPRWIHLHAFSNHDVSSMELSELEYTIDSSMICTRVCETHRITAIFYFMHADADALLLTK